MMCDLMVKWNDINVTLMEVTSSWVQEVLVLNESGDKLRPEDQTVYDLIMAGF